MGARARRHQAVITTGVTGLLTLILSSFSPAQVPSRPITSSGLGTTISDPISLPNNVTQFSITGGTRPGGGPNLFHSFGDFSIPANNIANFLNETSLPTSNILGRVTNGNPSNIFGTLQTTDFVNANLFLINPAGVVFGPNATLNIGGSVTFATADYIRLTDNVHFNAIPNAVTDALLSAAPVAAFGFLGSNPGTITAQGSQLSVSEGQGISLVGGNITVQAGALEDGTIQPARIQAPGGQISLASVASSGEIQASTFLPELGMTMGHIDLSQGSTIDVSSGAAGTVRIRGGQLLMDNATISADTVSQHDSSVAVDIQITGSTSVTADTNPALTARTTGAGDAGEIRITSGSMDITGITEDVLSVIDTHTSGTGKAGNITITTGDLQLTGDPVGLVFPINSGTTSLGTGGDVKITAVHLIMEDAFIATGDALREGNPGSAGNLVIKAESVDMAFSSIETAATIGKGGNLNLNAEGIHLEASSLSASSDESQSGRISIHSDTLSLVSGSSIDNVTASLPGGVIEVTGKVIEISGGSAIFSNTLGDGDAGPISIAATDRVSLVGTSRNVANGIFSNSGITGGTLGSIGGVGNAGDIAITTPVLELSGGSRISSVTLTSGNGGKVSINADTVLLSGQLSRAPREPLLRVGNELAGGIFTSTIGNSLCSGLCGNAGHVTISTKSLSLGAGSHINSSTSNNGQGGNVTLAATDTISLSGTLSDGTPAGIFSRTIGTTPDAGSGGNIALTAGQSVTISDGAAVSASSTGPGNAGNIAINAGQQFEMRNSSVKTEAAQASGGNIDIQAIDRIRLVNSSISTSVLGGAGSGGNISIDPNSVILQNSQIIAQAVQGAGGNISIVTPLFLADAGSLVDASSQFGLSGTVNIQSPTSNLAGTVSSLPSSLRQVQSLQTGRCAALADSRSSSLIVAGRDILPAEPGGWSPSPFALTMEQTDPQALAGEESSPLALSSPPVAAMTASADAPVSLRRLTPAGFLTQSFAENGLTGCRA